MKLEDLLDRLREFDLLLDADAKFPSIAGFVVGESVRGSWWAHQQSHQIFRLACMLHDHPDVLTVKLISGKITLVNRPLWPAVLAIGMAREPWQMRNLSKESKALLKKTGQETVVSSSGVPVRELEKRLLVYSASVHTERGLHSKQLQSWKSWADSAKLPVVKLPPAEAKTQLESVVARLNKQFAANGTLPWKSRAVL